MCWYNTLHSLLQHFNKKWGYNLMFNSCNQIIRKYSVDARNSPASIKQLFFPILFLSSLRVKCSDRVQLLRKLNIPLHLEKKKRTRRIDRTGRCHGRFVNQENATHTCIHTLVVTFTHIHTGLSSMKIPLWSCIDDRW